MSDDGINVRDDQGNVRHLKPYTAENPPAEGDVAWTHQQDPDLRAKRLREEFDTTDQSESIENGTVVEDDE